MRCLAIALFAVVAGACGDDDSGHGAHVDAAQPDGPAKPVLLDAETRSRGIAEDDTHVYWVVDDDAHVAGKVKSYDKGTGEIKELATGLHGPAAIARAGDQLFVALQNGNQIVQLPTSGGTPTVFADVQDTPRVIATDGTNVYWSIAGSDGGVRSQPIGGSTVTDLIANGLSTVTSLAVDATTVYVAVEGTQSSSSSSTGMVVSVPIAGGTVTQIATGQSEPFSIAVDDTSVFWANYGPGGIHYGGLYSSPKAGGTINTLYENNTMWNIVLVGDQIYVAAQGTQYTCDHHGVIYTVPKTGTSSPTSVLEIADVSLTGPVGSPTSFLVDGSDIYFAAECGGLARYTP